jgi:hypothetical protein
MFTRTYVRIHIYMYVYNKKRVITTHVLAHCMHV